MLLAKARRRTPPILCVARALSLLVIGGGVFAACGSGADSHDTAAARVEEQVAPNAQATAPLHKPDAPRNATDGGQALSQSGNAGVRSMRRRVKRPGGSVVTIPAAPTATTTDPENGCRDRGRAAPGAVPPAPGLSSQVSGRKITVLYRLGRFSQRCEIARLLVTLSSSSGAEVGTQRIVRAQRRGTITLRVPDYLPSADTVHVTAYARTAIPSRSSTIRIQG